MFVCRSSVRSFVGFFRFAAEPRLQVCWLQVSSHGALVKVSKSCANFSCPINGRVTSVAGWFVGVVPWPSYVAAGIHGYILFCTTEFVICVA